LISLSKDQGLLSHLRYAAHRQCAGASTPVPVPDNSMRTTIGVPHSLRRPQPLAEALNCQ